MLGSWISKGNSPQKLHRLDLLCQEERARSEGQHHHNLNLKNLRSFEVERTSRLSERSPSWSFHSLIYPRVFEVD